MAFPCSVERLAVWLLERMGGAAWLARRRCRPWSDDRMAAPSEDDENATVPGSRPNRDLRGTREHVWEEDVAADRKLDSTTNSTNDTSNLDRATNSFEKRVVVRMAIHDDGTD
jgi:hypothetical protein